MKALSLIQPWATFTVLGFKIWETRSRNIGIPLGLLLIHASKKVDTKDGLDLYIKFLTDFPHLARRVPAWADLPRGCIIGKVSVAATFQGVVPAHLDDLDKMMGDYTPGRYFAKLEMPEVFPSPFPMRGYQGIFNVPLPI